MSASAASALHPWDPLSYRLPHMRHATWFPLGYAVEIASNSAEVLNAASSVWKDYPARSGPPVVHFTVTVSSGSAPLASHTPLPRGQENLISIVDSAANFAVADLDRGFANICLTLNAAQDRRFVLDAFIEPLTYLMLGSRYFAMVHASCIAWNGRGVLLCGDSGAGKTCLAYMCAQSGWTFLSGDATQLLRGSRTHEVVGRPYSIRFRPSARQLFPELAAFPVTARAMGQKLDLDCATSQLGISTALTAKLDHVVFLERALNVDEASAGEFDDREAIAWLNQAVFYGDEQVRSQQRETLSGLLDLPILRLTYSNLQSAERVLRRLVDRP